MTTLQEILKHRTDISQYLVHWTDEKNFRGNLGIIRGGFFKATRGYKQVNDFYDPQLVPTIYGKYPAVCFSEMPVGNYIQSIDASERYEKRQYGIAVPKKVIYAYGGRPVLYGDKEFLKKLNEEDKYLFAHFDYSYTSDWTHEREWRVRPNLEANDRIGLKNHWKENGELLVPIHFPKLNSRGTFEDQLSGHPQFIILVKTKDEEKKFQEKIFFPGPFYVIGQSYYSEISDYQSKYLEALKKANVVSFERIRQERDNKGLWRLEDLIPTDTE